MTLIFPQWIYSRQVKGIDISFSLSYSGRPLFHIPGRVVRSEWWKGISNASYCILWRINITLTFVSWQHSIITPSLIAIFWWCQLWQKTPFFFHNAKLIRTHQNKDPQLFLQTHVKGKRRCRLLFSSMHIRASQSVCLGTLCPGNELHVYGGQILLNLQEWLSQAWRGKNYWAGHSYNEIPRSSNPLFPIDIFPVCSNVQRVGKSVMRKIIRDS